MDSVFVYGSDLTFNEYVYAFMRSYHLPDVEGQTFPQKDTWFIVAALRQNNIVNLVSAQIEATALMLIDSEGRTIKAHRINPLTAPRISVEEINAIRKEAFDIPLWEKLNQKPFPYKSMFDRTRMQQRFMSSGLTKEVAMNIESSNITYNAIRKKIQPRPCTTCGGKK